MSSRSIFVTLGLRADNFIKGSHDAANALGKVGDAGDQTAKKTSSGFKRLGDDVRQNRAELQTLGVGLAATGAAMLGVTTAVAKTGIEYNVLQQNSRAALKTLMGGAAQANAQMDKLDAFAKTSPFSKQVFIEAQRQMIGFGVEAVKVVPYLDAIQNATAAIGGNNNDIAQIVDVFAKIQSQGKITARELNMLGGHGIDAASLIGEAMGKTANQIREEITAGTLDANTALDALAEGMQGRFGGAAEAIKEQFTGALDRVGAAFRDFASDAMTLFVNPEGGGLLVGWTNSLADAIRALDKLPQGVKTAGVVLGGLGGAASLAAGGFLMLAPRIVDTIDAMNRLKATDGVLGSTARGLGAMGKAVGIVGVALAALKLGDLFMTPLRAANPEIEKTTAALLAMKDGSANLDQLFARIGAETMVASTGMSSMNDTFSAMEALINPNFMARMNDFAGTVLSLGGRAGRAERDALVKQFDQIGESLADMVASGNAERAAAIFADLSAQWVAAGGDIEDLKSLMPAYGASLQAVANDAELAADGNESLADSAAEAAAAAEQASAAYEGYLSALQGLQSYQDGLVNSFLAGRDAQREWDAATAAFAETAEHSEETLDAYAATARKSIMTMLEARDANGERIYSEEQLVDMMQQSREAVIATAEAMGYEKGEAEALADSMGLIPEEISTRVAVEDAAARAAIAEIDEALGGIPEEVATTLLGYGDQAVEVAAAVQSAIEGGVPEEWITRLLADDYASAEADRARMTIERIHRNWNTDIEAVDEASQKARNVKTAIESIPAFKNSTITATDNATGILGGIRRMLASIQSKTVTVTTLHSGTTVGGRTTAYATGGPVFGPGTGTSDSILARLSNNEHVSTAAEVRSLGGHGAMLALRQAMLSRPQDVRAVLGMAPGFAQGGSPSMVSRPVMVPQPPRAAQTVSFKNMEITGRLSFDKSGLVSIIDGRVVKYV